MIRSLYVVQALDWIFRYPVFSSSSFVNEAGIPAPTSRRVLGALRESNILKVLEQGSGRRPAIFVFPDLPNAAEGKEVF